MATLRRATLFRLTLGGACLAVPGAVLAVIGAPDRDDGPTQRVTQVLGVRLLGQACLDLALGARTRGLDISVDVLHAGSMVPVALLWPGHRRSAAVSASAAAGTALLDLAAGRRTARQPGM
jgi:hypothetical protein